MTVRPPQSLSPSLSRDTGLNLLEYELMSERADALGRHGLKVEKAIAALSVLSDPGTTPERREQLLDDAADVVWAFSSSAKSAACAQTAMPSSATVSRKK